MLKGKIVVLGLVLFVFSACVGSKPKPPKPKPPVKIVEIAPVVIIKKPVGIGISKLEKVERFKENPFGYYYYGQLLIEPKLSMNAVKGVQSKSLLTHVAELFHDHRKNFGLSVTPIVDGVILPDIILFTYSYNSRTQSWTTTLNENPRTGMVLLTPSTELQFKFKYISINERDFAKIKEITSLFNGGSWILSKASQPMINMISGRIGDILSNSVATSVTNAFVPVSDGIKSVSYEIQTKDAQALATVKFSVKLSSSVVSGQVDVNHMNTIPKADKFTNPLNVMRTNLTSAYTLYDDLNRAIPLNRFSLLKRSRDFRDMCRNVLNELDTYGLNQFDKLNAFSQILDTTDFTRNAKFYTSGCLLNHEKHRLKEMGIPLELEVVPTHAHVIIDDTTLDMLAGYMKSPKANIGHKSQLLTIFSPTIVSLEAQNTALNGFEALSEEEYPTDVTAQNILERFEKIGMARACCYRFPRKRHTSFLFRALNSETIYRLKLSRQTANGYISSLTIQPWDEEKITPYNLKRLQAVAENNIERSEKDILIN
jgi:hypothetical protein